MVTEPETVPKAQGEQSPRRQKAQRYIKVYFSSTEELQTWADRATSAGFRRGGLQILNKKPHGWEGETVFNTDGISKYLKDCEEKVATANELAVILRKLLDKPRRGL